MLFAEVAISEAEGGVLVHALRLGDRRLKKGHVLSAADIGAALDAGVRRVTIARLEAADVAEDAAASRIAMACAGEGVRVAAPFTGRANLYATRNGLLEVDRPLIDAVNAVDESITIATLPPYALVRPQQMLATIKIIPFASPAVAIERAERLLKGERALDVAPLVERRAALISTALPDTRTALLDKSRTALDSRLAALGSQIVLERRVAHRVDAVAVAIGEALAAAGNPILILGASAIADRRDVIPSAIVAAGGEIVHFGMPVDPGNLLLLGRIGETTVIGLPSCARSSRPNGVDFVLQRVLAGLPLGAAEISAMGVGGLLTEIASRPQLREEGVPPVPHAPSVAAVVLAAGLSSRMGRNKLLVDLDGKPLVRRTVEAAAGSAAEPVFVVTGNQAPEVRDALSGLAVEFVHNPDFRFGLSTSLKAGIRALPGSADGVLVLLGDMPAITSSLIDRMIAAFDPQEGRAICVATHHGKRGNPVLWDRRFFADILALEGDVGAKHLVAANSELVCEIESGDDAPLTDIDTPEALDSWVSRTRNE